MRLLRLIVSGAVIFSVGAVACSSAPTTADGDAGDATSHSDAGPQRTDGTARGQDGAGSADASRGHDAASPPPTCPSGLTFCASAGNCVDLKTATNYCGSCDLGRALTQLCLNGACACPPATVLVGTACVARDAGVTDAGHDGPSRGAAHDSATATDAAHDSSMGRHAAHDAGDGTTGGSPCTTSSDCREVDAAGATCCSGACVDTQTDPDDCGSCGAPCATPNATPECAAGACTIAACNAGYADCDGDASDGCEVDINTNPAACGGCANACTTVNGTPDCVNGACGIGTCNPGFANCSGIVSDGCNIDVSGPAACGTCEGCLPGHCTDAGCRTGPSCSPGFAACDPDEPEDCVTDVETDPSNCGGCGVSCGVGCVNCVATRCNAGACEISGCVLGHADCDGIESDGCEVDLLTDPNDCGGCRVVCDGGTCTGGAWSGG